MNVSLNGLWANTNNYIRTRIAEGLTPLQRKVALFATAFFALAAVGYVFYKICYKYPTEIEVIDPQEEDKPELVKVKEESKNQQVAQSPSPSELDDKDPLDPREVNVEEIVPSSASIAIHNADQLRSLINRYPAEARHPSGQARTLYFDAEGRLQGITHAQLPPRLHSARFSSPAPSRPRAAPPFAPRAQGRAPRFQCRKPSRRTSQERSTFPSKWCATAPSCAAPEPDFWLARSAPT